jgi:hypothetical protein
MRILRIEEPRKRSLRGSDRVAERRAENVSL